MSTRFVRHLNLWKKQLGRVPAFVWEQTELETLGLADNGLSEVSEQIGGLETLRMLDLGHNKLASVPEALGDLAAAFLGPGAWQPQPKTWSRNK